MLKTSDLDYDLPEELIATVPAARRDAARLLVTGRAAGSGVAHRVVSDLPSLLRAGDVLVFNTTRVLAARLIGSRRDTGGRVEGLYLGEAAAAAGSDELCWRVLLRAKRLRAGCVVDLEPRTADGPGAALTLSAEGTDGPGSWVVRVQSPGCSDSGAVLERVGRTPLPPYILGARKRSGLEVAEETDRARYQTVYAEAGPGASVAAPTAGLHFTPELLQRLREMGVQRADVTLHVGTGTFKPVETETLEAHPMHAEWCRAEPGALDRVRAARGRGGRVIAVGTTATRALESLAEVGPGGAAAGVWTRLLIAPGHRWQLVDGLLTNFHLPRSTLMALVAALLEDGVPGLKSVYQTAVRERYRFYSFGDAMLIVPGPVG